MIIEDRALIEAAWEARSRAKSKYSNFKVGAALLCSDGSIITGCNIESSSYGLTICAERCALFKALSEGYDKGEFRKMVVVTDTGEPISPCGACRQVLWEWAPEMEILCIGRDGKSRRAFIKELFPFPFDNSDFKPGGED